MYETYAILSRGAKKLLINWIFKTIYKRIKFLTTRYITNWIIICIIFIEV